MSQYYVNSESSGTVDVQTLTGNSGGAVPPTGGNINTLGTGSITIAGNPGTSTLTTQLTGLTNHNVLVGAGTATITNVAPSATAGIPLVSTGAASDPAFGTASIAGGGTNATSFTQANGIVTYDGTSLVNYVGPQISSAGRMTNTSQTAFASYLASTVNNVTGAGTVFTLGTGTALTKIFDNGTDFNTNGTFTAPVTGRYFFSALFAAQEVTAAMTYSQIYILTSNRTWTNFYINAGAVRTLSVNVDFVGYQLTIFTDMDAGDTAVTQLQIASGAGDTVDVFGAASPASTFSGYLVC